MELLEYLAKQSGCYYISDLRFTKVWKKVLNEMKKEENILRHFSIYEWEEAIRYLKKVEPYENSIESILEQLLEREKPQICFGENNCESYLFKEY